MGILKYTNANGENINVENIGFFTIPELDKEYIMYSLTDDNKENDMGHVLLGEVIRNEDNIQILGILSEEKDLVVAFYNEISKQIVGENYE